METDYAEVCKYLKNDYGIDLSFQDYRILLIILKMNQGYLIKPGSYEFAHWVYFDIERKFKLVSVYLENRAGSRFSYDYPFGRFIIDLYTSDTIYLEAGANNLANYFHKLGKKVLSLPENSAGLYIELPRPIEDKVVVGLISDEKVLQHWTTQNETYPEVAILHIGSRYCLVAPAESNSNHSFAYKSSSDLETIRYLWRSIM